MSQPTHGGYRRPSNPAPVSKQCTRCGLVLPIERFNKARGGKPRARCKECQQIDYREYIERDPERHAVLRRASKYRVRFNMAMEEVEALFAAAGYSCECCGVHREATPNGVLVLDHDHSCCPGERSCGKCVRGVLCTKCNVGLGALDDDPLKTIALMEYITTRSGLEICA